MIHELGGDETYLTLEGMDKLCTVKKQIPIEAGEAGYVVGMQAELIGRAAQVLGAGRATKEDSIDPAVGLIMHKRVGDKVEKGEAFCTLYVNDERTLPMRLRPCEMRSALDKSRTKSHRCLRRRSLIIFHL
jgi:thymidine phosphorylase